MWLKRKTPSMVFIPFSSPSPHSMSRQSGEEEWKSIEQVSPLIFCWLDVFNYSCPYLNIHRQREKRAYRNESVFVGWIQATCLSTRYVHYYDHYHYYSVCMNTNVGLNLYITTFYMFWVGFESASMNEFNSDNYYHKFYFLTF